MTSMRFASRLLASLVVFDALTVLAAKTVYVDCQLEDYSGHDGSTPELALKTLDEAVRTGTSYCATDGDTVLVAPGTYNLGSNGSADLLGQCRLYITQSITVKSTQGAAVTIIEGEGDTSATRGIGAGAVRCIGVNTSENVVIEGFTLRGGRTPTGANGGAFAACKGQQSARLVAVVDSIIEDCDASSYPISQYGTFVRTIIRNNAGYPTGGTMSLDSNFLNCVFVDNAVADGEGMIHVGQGKFINCTFINNKVNHFWFLSSLCYNCIWSYGSYHAANTGFTRTNCLTDTYNTRYLIAPALQDYHVVAGSDAATAGDAAYRGADYLTLPSGVERDLDIDGKAVPTTGAIPVGAAVSPVTPAAGCLRFNVNRFSVDGTVMPANCYFYPTNYPVVYNIKVLTDDGSRPRFYWQSTGNSLTCGGFNGTGVVWPLMDDSANIIPNPDANGYLWIDASNYLAKDSNIVWADPKADPATADGSEDHPYATLLDAVTNRTGNVVVCAKAGVYDKGEVWYNWNGCTAKTRLLIENGARVIAVDGPEKTFLVGDPDPDTLSDPDYPGCGANAVLPCIGVSQAVLQGFTVTRGYTTNKAQKEFGNFYTFDRGVIFSWGGFYVADCIISNNIGRYYSVGLINANRCRITENTGAYGIVGGPNCALISSAIYGNTIKTSERYHLAGSMLCANCSVVGDAANSAFENDAGQVRLNTIVDDGGITTRDTISNLGCVFNGFTTYLGSNYLKADPYFVNKTTGDLRLATDSPAFGAGVAIGDAREEATGATNWWAAVASDINGNKLKFDANGKVLPGAFQTNFATGVRLHVDQAGLTVTGAAASGFTEITGEKTVTISAGTGSRPCPGIVVNGVTNNFETLADHQYVWTPALGTKDITAYYSTEWYVSPSGAATATGFYPSDPASLQDGLTKAISGDTVWALRGTYETGKMIQAPNGKDVLNLYSRAVVPDGVTLASVEGREVTIIKGAAAATPDPQWEPTWCEKSSNGLGIDALRCVLLNGKNAKVKGFTLADGHTRDVCTDVAWGHADTIGGGIYSYPSAKAVAEDCIITNCVAFIGGGAHSTKTVGCIFANDKGVYSHAPCTGGEAYYCLSFGSKIDYPYIAGFKGMTGDKLVGCTADCLWIRNAYWQEVVDCVCLQASMEEAATNKIGSIRNTVFRKTGLISYSVYQGDDAIISTYMPTCRVITNEVEELVFDDMYRPVVGKNYAIDRGSAEADATAPETDIYGGQRIYNATRDIGAVEADWRVTYGKDLGHLNKVLAADPAVVEADGKVRLTDGTKIVAQRLGSSSAAKTIKISATVSTGTLTVLVNGESAAVLTPSAASTELTLTHPLTDELTFAYAGDGYADISRIINNSGLVLILN